MSKNVLIKKVSDLGGEFKYYTDYLITSNGDVFSLKSNKKIETNKEYKQVTLWALDDEDKKIGKCVAIHILVARAFIDNPNNYGEVDHINSDKYDNRVENLQWISRKMNMEKVNYKNRNSMKRAVVVIHIESQIAMQFESLSEACRELDLNYSCAYAVMTNLKKSTRGFRIISL